MFLRMTTLICGIKSLKIKLIFEKNPPVSFQIKKAAGEGTGCLTEGSNKGFSFTLVYRLLLNFEENMKYSQKEPNNGSSFTTEAQRH